MFYNNKPSSIGMRLYVINSKMIQMLICVTKAERLPDGSGKPGAGRGLAAYSRNKCLANSRTLRGPKTGFTSFHANIPAHPALNL